jgi:CBS domain-containing protein
MSYSLEGSNMSKVAEILSEKGSHLLSVGAEATVLDAALLMNEHQVGALVVTEAGRIVGIFSERDVLRRIVAERRDPAVTRISEVMTSDVVCGTPDTLIEEARGVMKHRRIRHLPIIGESHEVLGMISIGDLNAWRLDGQERTIHYLQEYLYGRA